MTKRSCRWESRAATVAICAALGGCAAMDPNAKIAKVDYTAVTSAEEAATRFQKMSDDGDNVVGPIPLIWKVSNRTFWSYDVRNRFAVSTDGQKLAFIGEQNGNRNIWVKDVSGSGAKVQRTFRTRVVDPVFSPDGKWIAYSENRNGAYNIFLVDPIGGSAVRQVTTDEVSNSYPFFSPDGMQLYYVQNEFKSVQKSNRDSVWRETYPTGSLWSRSLETGMLTQFGEATTPSLSPDGRIAVVRFNVQTGTSELWLLDLTKSNETIIYSGAGLRDPAVSPDGKQIAFVGFSQEKGKGDNLDIFVVGVDGTGLTQLTFHRGHDVCPRWSPDGKGLYFLSQRGSAKGKWNIWRMDLGDRSASAGASVKPVVAVPVAAPASMNATPAAVAPAAPVAAALDPYQQLQKSGAQVVVVTKSGTEWAGLITGVAPESVKLKAGEVELSIRRSDIREVRLK